MDPMPLKRAKTRAGDPLLFLQNDCMTYDDKDNCLIWPYSGARGYGQLAVAGRKTYASRYVCEKTHGPPPSPHHHAAHSCNNGHNGCVSKFHLSWKTPTENAQDKIDCGTMVRGGKMHSAILDEDKVLIIRAMQGKLSMARLARIFGVGDTTIWQIQHGKKWAWLDAPK